MMFVILQKYDFSSKSQLQVNGASPFGDVCDTAKVRFFKQITTLIQVISVVLSMFVILQKYDFSSKSQRDFYSYGILDDVCDTAKVRFFKQITTLVLMLLHLNKMFVILQKYDFSSKSQRLLSHIIMSS